MRSRLLLLAALWCLGISLPGRAAIGDDPPAPPTPTDPPKPDDPPKPADPPRPDPGGGDPAAPKPKPDEDPPEPQPEPPKPAEGEKQPDERPAECPRAPRPGPGGMMYVPGGEAWIGTDSQPLSKLLENRPKEVRDEFDFERPRHTVLLPSEFADRNELSNAQYLTFLQQACLASYDTSKGSLANLVEIAGFLTGVEDPKEEKILWRQMAEANKETLTKALPNLKWPDEFRFTPLPRGLVLVFYNRRPPDNWPSNKPAEDMMNHPVRYVNFIDFEACAAWAGKHILTEEEW